MILQQQLAPAAGFPHSPSSIAAATMQVTVKDGDVCTLYPASSLMENDLLDSCKKLLTQGYTGVVVSDNNGLPVFGMMTLVGIVFES